MVLDQREFIYLPCPKVTLRLYYRIGSGIGGALIQKLGWEWVYKVL